MVFAILANPIRLARVLVYYILISGAPSEKVINQETEPNLVRVNIVTETLGAKNTVEINGKLLTDYSPTIIQSLSATGIVLDNRGHIMTFLGYRWIDIQDHQLRISISNGEGQKWKGKLVGIDQSNGVAVIKLLNGKLAKTPVCTDCEVKDGVTIAVPAIEGPAPSQYGEAQILSVGANPGITGQGNWTVAVNRPFPDVGQPILTMDRQVLGFVASQDPMGALVVYPISQLLSSAEKILKTGSDIRTGWLGVFLIDAPPETGSGIVIRRVEPDSPAQRAGLVPDDLLLKFNGREILDARQFIQLVQSTPIGSEANLEIIRRGKAMDVTALVGARKPLQSQGKLSFNLSGAFGSIFAGMQSAEPGQSSPHLLFGLDTAVLTPFLTDALQMPEQTGLLVTGVAKKMPADLAGIMVGDVIVAIDGQPIVDPLDFASFLQTHNWGPQAVFKVLRRGTEQTITVQIPD